MYIVKHSLQDEIIKTNQNVETTEKVTRPKEVVLLFLYCFFYV